MPTFADSITVAELDADPYPIFARLRAQEPVAWVPALRCWLVTRAADVEHVTTHPELFTAEAPDAPIDRSFGGPTLMTMDGAEHLAMRRALDAKFRPRVVATYIDDLVAPIAAAALSGASERSTATISSAPAWRTAPISKAPMGPAPVTSTRLPSSGPARLGQSASRRSITS